MKLPKETKGMATLAAFIVSRHRDKRLSQQKEVITERKGELEGKPSAQ